jgi:hypothetical protein
VSTSNAPKQALQFSKCSRPALVGGSLFTPKNSENNTKGKSEESGRLERPSILEKPKRPDIPKEAQKDLLKFYSKIKSN